MTKDQTHWNDRYARGDIPWDTGQVSSELIRILQQFSIGPCRVLEMGCGTGTDAVYLKQQGFDVVAVDISPLAVERARQRAAEADVEITLLAANVLSLGDVHPPFPLIYDRGLYHAIRREQLDPFLGVLGEMTTPGSLYLTMAGNANEQVEGEEGPPRVSAEQMCHELSGLFHLVQLTECHFEGVVVDDRQINPLAWSALWRRKP